VGEITIQNDGQFTARLLGCGGVSWTLEMFLTCAGFWLKVAKWVIV
jgi:hypothetical protein